LIDSIIQSEPFATQSILNEIVIRHYSVGVDHLAGVGYSVIPFATDFGAPITSFNELFQPALFPQIQGWAIANNIWGEMLSSAGWPLLCAFILLFVGLAAWGGQLLSGPNPEICASVAMLFSTWAFYVHRNDLAFQVTLERRTLGVALLGLLVSRFFFLAKSQFQPRPQWRLAAGSPNNPDRL
jgi:hypothetical protein